MMTPRQIEIHFARQALQIRINVLIGHHGLANDAPPIVELKEQIDRLSAEFVAAAAAPTDKEGA